MPGSFDGVGSAGVRGDETSSTEVSGSMMEEETTPDPGEGTAPDPKEQDSLPGIGEATSGTGKAGPVRTVAVTLIFLTTILLLRRAWFIVLARRGNRKNQVGKGK